MGKNNFEWLDRNEYPFTSRYFGINGQRLHYIDEGDGEVLLFVHGTPSWSFDFRKIISDLKSDYRCIAVDHIGFGLSDKPKDYDYSTVNHAQTLKKFIHEKQIENITLVLHDFGGPIGFDFAIKHPEKVKRIVVLNSWLWSSESDPKFIKLSKLLKSPLLPFLYKNLNFSPRVLLPKSFGETKLTRKTLIQYIKPFRNRHQRNGPFAFAKSLLNDQQWFEKLWNEKEPVILKPVLFIWGMKDPIISPRHLEKFETGFPKSSTLQLETSGHFPQEEEPARTVSAIRGFMKSEFNK